LGLIPASWERAGAIRYARWTGRDRVRR